MLIVQEIWKKTKVSGLDKLRVAILTRAAPKFVVPQKQFSLSLLSLSLLLLLLLVCLFVCLLFGDFITIAKS
jgi:hypothetical protein